MTTTRSARPAGRDLSQVRVSYATLGSPIGTLALAWRADAVVSLVMAEAERPGRWDTGYREGGPVARLREQLTKRFGDVTLVREDRAPAIDALARYFGGALDALDSVPADPGGTALQSAIWKRLRTIPAGRTMTYGELARAVGRPKASRAAGRAVGTNPIPLIVPCHRIVGSDGTLTGFGGGLARKRWLLRHEGALREIV